MLDGALRKTNLLSRVAPGKPYASDILLEILNSKNKCDCNLLLRLGKQLVGLKAPEEAHQIDGASCRLAS
jgi:hypothetical protein